jgi:YHS domain-containing protein
MMRGLLILVFIAVIYYALKTVFRSAIRSYHEEDRKRVRIMGEDMVQDPECRTYVPKGRAVTRRIGDSQRYFCSEACAKRYEERHGT